MATNADPTPHPLARVVRTRRVPYVTWLVVGWMLFACGADPAPPEAPPLASEAAPPAEAVARGTQETSVSGRPGRIILVSMDTVRADHVGGDADADTTPRLAEIAAEGVRFDRFYAAASYTLPATMSIFTGLDPVEHGVWTEAASLAPGVPTLAETLRDAGYTPVGLHEGGYVAAHFGFDRGFQNYSQFDQRQVIESGMPALLAWIQAAGANPYFLFLHTYAAHAPYGGFTRYRESAPDRGLPDDEGLASLRERYPRRGPDVLSPAGEAPEITRRLCSFYNQVRDDIGDFLGCGYGTLSRTFPDTPDFERDRDALVESYDTRIAAIDAAIGEVRDQLVALGLWDDTLLIVTSDHGEAFFEHGLYQHDHVPFEEALRVPLIVSWPARLREGPVRRVDTLAWHLDLMPTLLSLSEASTPEGLRGSDLSPLLLDAGASIDDRTLHPAVFRMPRGGAGSLRRVALAGDEKYIEGHAAFGDAEGLLFDLARDPGEAENLRAARPERFRELADATRSYAGSLTPIPARHRSSGEPITASPDEFVEAASLPAEEEEALRALGYRE